MRYDFDSIIERKNTRSSKWDNVGPRTGNSDALPMWVADMDFVCPQPVVEAVTARARHPVYGYTYEMDDFKEVTKSWIAKRHGWEIDPKWVVFSTGVCPVLNTAVQCFSDVGDEIIIQRPVYHPFGFAVTDNDRVISDNSLIYKDGRYTLDYEDLERRAASPRAKVMILCNPHNPVGRCWDREELTRMADICCRHNVIMVSDEIHSDLMLFGSKHTPVASLDARFAMNTITCYAPSKTFNIAGIRASGIVIPNPEIREKIQKRFKQNRTIQENIFAAPAYIAAYTQSEDYLEQLLAYLEDNVRYLDKFLKEKMPKIKLVKPEALYLMWLDCRELGLTPEELDNFFIFDSRVAINKGTMFGEEGGGFERINIGCPRAVLKTGLEQIYGEYQKRGF